MKLLFHNHTDYIAYIIIVDFDEKTLYIAEPVILELESGQTCVYETTPTYFFGAMIDGQRKLHDIIRTANGKELYHSDDCGWYSNNHYGNYVNNYLIHYPQTKLPKICDNKDLKDYAMTILSKRYDAYCSVDIKEPCDN